MSNRRGLTITRGTKKLPQGSPLKRKQDLGKCQLGGLSHHNWICRGDAVVTIANVDICAEHLKRIKAIKKASDKKHDPKIGRAPRTQVYRRVA